MEFGIAQQIQSFSNCPHDMLWARRPHLTGQPSFDYTNPDKLKNCITSNIATYWLNK